MYIELFKDIPDSIYNISEIINKVEPFELAREVLLPDFKIPKKFIQNKFRTKPKPINFVFHGGSGSSLEEIREAIGYGVIKMNIDTDLQWGFTTGVRDYFLEKGDYVKCQIGKPEGKEKPNKKYYDPRVWLRKGEISFKNRLKKAFEDAIKDKKFLDEFNFIYSFNVPSMYANG